ncbi:MAG: hypothetical protein HKM07_08490 [Chlamydiae bacterium]|nr:hypothetical protein [Chlamydiota bacterium]
MTYELLKVAPASLNTLQTYAKTAIAALPLAVAGKVVSDFARASLFGQASLVQQFISNLFKQAVMTGTQTVAKDPAPAKAAAPFIMAGFYCSLPENLDYQKAGLYILGVLALLRQAIPSDFRISMRTVCLVLLAFGAGVALGRNTSF